MNFQIPLGRALLLLLVASLAGERAYAMQLTVEEQLAAAVIPLGHADRNDATVFGYRNGTDLEVLRWGSNDLVCESDRPGDASYQVRCSNAGLRQYLLRSDELNAAGIQGDARREVLMAELEAGMLRLPSGSVEVALKGRVNSETGLPDSLTETHYIYLPFATTESTGLSTDDSGNGQPFLMDAGKIDAHIHVPGTTRPFRRGRKAN